MIMVNNPFRVPLDSACVCPSADDGKLGTKLYHAVNMVVLAGVPAAVATSPSALTMPLDIVLGIALPLHAHVGMNYGEQLFLLFLSLDSDGKPL